ncbi:electron transfer flavoprotein subunit alpha/FixB family protein [Desulfosporosinus fructosivorans]
MKIWVFAEKYTALNELCRGARQLGERVEGIIVGSPEGVISADKVWSIPAQEGAMLEDYTESIVALVEKEKPELLLVAPTKRGKLIAGRLAAMLGASVSTDVMKLTQDGEAKRMVYGGTAVRREKATTPTAIVMVGPGVLVVSAEAATSQAEVATVDFIEPTTKMKVISKEQKPKVTVDLPSAKRVVGVGRGIALAEDIAMARQLAEAIGGEVGCSRPIAEGEKWMPKETYIGVSGLMLAPEVYFALGISGQVQHMVGINRSKVVIAINKDKNAPIFKQADYGIVGDLYKIVPALLNQLK